MFDWNNCTLSPDDMPHQSRGTGTSTLRLHLLAAGCRLQRHGPWTAEAEKQIEN